MFYLHEKQSIQLTRQSSPHQSKTRGAIVQHPIPKISDGYRHTVTHTHKNRTRLLMKWMSLNSVITHPKWMQLARIFVLIFKIIRLPLEVLTLTNYYIRITVLPYFPIQVQGICCSHMNAINSTLRSLLSDCIKRQSKNQTTFIKFTPTES